MTIGVQVTVVRSLCAIVLIAAGSASACREVAAPAPPRSLEFPLKPPPPPGSGDISRGNFTWPLPLASAQTILLKTEVFEFGGMPPKRQVQAFNVVFDQPDALGRFRWIARQAGPAGRLYALCALVELDPPDAQLLQLELAGVPEPIDVSDSDVGSRPPIAQVAQLAVSRRLGVEFRRSRGEVDTYYRDRDTVAR